MGLDITLRGTIWVPGKSDGQFEIESINVRLGYWRGWRFLDLTNMILENVVDGNSQQRLRASPNYELWLSDDSLSRIEEALTKDCELPEEERLFQESDVLTFEQARRWLAQASENDETRDVFLVVSG